MEDFGRILSNVQKMIDQSAPGEDIDGYLQSEGMTPEQFKSRASAGPQVAPSQAPGSGPSPEVIAQMRADVSRQIGGQDPTKPAIGMPMRRGNAPISATERPQSELADPILAETAARTAIALPMLMGGTAALGTGAAALGPGAGAGLMAGGRGVLAGAKGAGNMSARVLDVLSKIGLAAGGGSIAYDKFTNQ